MHFQTLYIVVVAVVSPYLSILAHSIRSCTSGRHKAQSTTNTNPVPTSWSPTVYTSSIVNIVCTGCTPDYAIWSALDLIQSTRNITPLSTWEIKIEIEKRSNYFVTVFIACPFLNTSLSVSLSLCLCFSLSLSASLCLSLCLCVSLFVSLSLSLLSLYCIVLHCTVLYCVALYCILLYSSLLYCNVLYCIALYHIVFHCIVLYCIVLYI